MWGPDRAKGKMDELVGKAKRAVGKLTDDDARRAEDVDNQSHGRAEPRAAKDLDGRGDATHVQGEESG